MKYLVYALLLIALALPQIAGAQEPPDPKNPDNLQPPFPGVPETENGALEKFYPYTPAESYGTYAVHVGNPDLVFTIRTCPSRAAWCWENVPNRSLGYVGHLQSVKVDPDNCKEDSDGKDGAAIYKWCHVPDYDLGLGEHTDTGWIAVCYAESSDRHGCWYEFKRVQGG